MGPNRPGSLRRHSRNVALRIVAAQVLVGVVIAAALLLLAGWHACYSALTGALIAALPSYYLVVRMFRPAHNPSVEDVLRNIYVAEILKVGMTIALFALAIIALNVDFAVLIGAYASAVAVNWFGIRFADLGERPQRQLGRVSS